MDNSKAKLNVEQWLESICVAHNKTTIMTPAPSGGFLVYVSAREMDTTRALMSALIDIKMRRGEMGSETDTVKIRPVLVASPGNQFYFELRGANGEILTNGYAPTEEVARRRMALWEMKNAAPKPGDTEL